MLCFGKQQALEPLLCLPMHQVGECKREQQRQHACNNDENERAGQLRTGLCFELCQGVRLDVVELRYLGTNLIHQAFAGTAAEQRQVASGPTVTAQLNHSRHFLQLGVNQRSECVQIFLRRADQDDPPQFAQMTTEVAGHREVRFKVGFVTGEQVAALTGLRVFQVGQQVFGLGDDSAGMRSRFGCFLGMPERCKGQCCCQRNQEDGSGQQCDNFVNGFQDDSLCAESSAFGDGVVATRSFASA